MTQTTPLSPPGSTGGQSPEQTRAAGLKLVIVGMLALAMWIPALFLYFLSFERSERADSVKQEIYEREGGEQRLAGPFLLIPVVEEVTGYVPVNESRGEESTRRYVHRTLIVLPNELAAAAALTTATRSRSIYDATVYEAGVTLTGDFDLSGLAVSPRADVLWHEARLGVSLSGRRALTGLRGTPALTLAGRQHAAPFEPGYDIIDGPVEKPGRATGPGLSTPVVIGPETRKLAFALSLDLAGGGSFGLAPLGDDTTVEIIGDWPHPGFQGQFSPIRRNIDETGFTAAWTTSYLARSLASSFEADEPLNGTFAAQMLSVDLVNPDSPYGKINRSLKYALLFMGLIFLTVFILEVVFRSRAHPAQYILIGLAQVLFYLMVLALSEHIPFNLAFAGMSAATVLLSGLYAGSIFRRLSAALISMAVFSGVYGLIWLLMKSEDYALLIGASVAFTALALTMFVTRDIDWYGQKEGQKAG